MFGLGWPFSILGLLYTEFIIILESNRYTSGQSLSWCQFPFLVICYPDVMTQTIMPVVLAKKKDFATCVASWRLDCIRLLHVHPTYVSQTTTSYSSSLQPVAHPKRPESERTSVQRLQFQLGNLGIYHSTAINTNKSSSIGICCDIIYISG